MVPSVIAALREKQPDVPALAMSGFADGERTKILESMSVKLLQKPLLPSELLAEIRLLCPLTEV